MIMLSGKSGVNKVDFSFCLYGTWDERIANCKKLVRFISGRKTFRALEVYVTEEDRFVFSDSFKNLPYFSGAGTYFWCGDLAFMIQIQIYSYALEILKDNQ